MEHRANLALYFGQDLVSSAALTQSEIKALFDTRTFDNWKKAQENRDKSVGALIKGVNNVIKGLGILAKMLPGRARR